MSLLMSFPVRHPGPFSTYRDGRINIIEEIVHQRRLHPQIHFHELAHYLLRGDIIERMLIYKYRDNETETIKAIFERWLETGGRSSPPTWLHLITALHRADLYDLADEIGHQLHY